jgi:hypothetical protein
MGFVWDLDGKNISQPLKFTVKWKHLACGFIMYDLTDKVNFFHVILTTIVYAIFTENSRSKYDNILYGNIDIQHSLKRNFIYY